MSKKEVPYETINKICNIIKQVYALEKIFINGINKQKEKFFFVDKIYFDAYKNNISYDILKKDIEKKKSWEAQKLISDLFTPNKQLKYLSPVEIKNSRALLDKLNANQSKFCIINSEIAINSFNKKKSEEIKLEDTDKGNFFEIKNKKIIIYFNSKEGNDCLYFKINNGIIERSSLYDPNKEPKIQIPESKKTGLKKEKNINNELNNQILFNALIIDFKTKYKKHLMILIRLFMFYKENKTEENTSFSFLN